MRPFKSFVSLPLAASLHLVWDRITLSKLTVFYFLFSLLHASLQIILQAEVFSINSQAADLINEVVTAGGATAPGFSILKKDELLWCTDPARIPGSCNILWRRGNTTQTVDDDDSTYYAAASYTSSITSQAAQQTEVPAIPLSVGPAAPSSPTLPAVQPESTAILTVEQEQAIAAQVQSQQNSAGVQASHRKRLVITFPIGTLENQSITQDFSPDCLTALQWPLETLRNTKREDIVFLNFHLWVLGMSIVAILNESFVHMLATLVTHALLTAWSIFQILQTQSFQRNFAALITHGLCVSTSPTESLLSTYWSQRASVELPAAALNGAALLLSFYLTYRLVVTYNWATFKRIGADRRVSKAYKMVLAFSVTLQLSMFFIVVSVALWIDQLCNGAIGKFALQMNVYRALYIGVLICLAPWIVAGWRSVRREHRLLMAAFLTFDALLIGGWASMFASTTFRLTFTQWRFFAAMSIIAVILTLGCLASGIMCRMGFGSGNDLRRRLSDGDSLPDGFVSALPPGSDRSSDKSSIYSYEEKVAFPESTLPSFTRFPSNPASDNGSSYGYGYTPYKAPSLTRTNSTGSTDSSHSSHSAHSAKSGATHFSRPAVVPSSRFSMDSIDGRSGMGSEVGYGSERGHGGGGGSKGKRWVIE